MPELSAPFSQQLSDTLACTVTMQRHMGDRSTELSIVVTTAWDADEVAGQDRELLTRHLLGEPDEEGWFSAQVATLHGNLFDLTEPDVLDQADEISALALAIVAHLHQDGDTVSPLCDRLAYLLGSPLRFVQAGESEPPEVERPRHWWLARGWHDAGEDVLVRHCGP